MVVPWNWVLSKIRARTTATAKKTTPAMSDSRPPATLGVRTLVRRPTARSRTDGSVTRAMNKKIMGSAVWPSVARLWGRWGST